MTRTYTTREGDVLDLICYRHYAGRQSGAVEAVLDHPANQHIGRAAYDAILPRGLVITLPELPESRVARVPTVKLWD